MWKVERQCSSCTTRHPTTVMRGLERVEAEQTEKQMACSRAVKTLLPPLQGLAMSRRVRGKAAMPRPPHH